MQRAAQSTGQQTLVHLVTFSSGEPFASTQKLLDQSLDIAGISSHAMWVDSIEAAPRYKALSDRINTLDPRQKKRGGFWKPLLILDKLDQVRPGEFVLFHDASQYIREPFRHDMRPLARCMEHSKEDVLAGVRLRGTLEWEYSQCGIHYGDAQRAFSFCEALNAVVCPGVSAGCCNREQEGLLTLLNTWHLWRNTPVAHRLLERWLELNLSPLSLRVPLLDQSLLELLALENNLLTVLLPTAFFDKSHLQLHPRAIYDESNFQKSINVVFDHLRDARLLPFNSVSGIEWSSRTVPAYLWRESLSCSQPRDSFDMCWSGGVFSYRICCGESWGLGGNPNCWDAETSFSRCCRPHRDIAVCIGAIDGLGLDEKLLWEALVRPLDADVIIKAQDSDSLQEFEGMYPSAVAVVSSCDELGSFGRRYRRVLRLDSIRGLTAAGNISSRPRRNRHR